MSQDLLRFFLDRAPMLGRTAAKLIFDERVEINGEHQVFSQRRPR